MVESQPSKLLVTGSIPVSRSSMKLETRKWKVEATEFPSGQSGYENNQQERRDFGSERQRTLG